MKQKEKRNIIQVVLLIYRPLSTKNHNKKRENFIYNLKLLHIVQLNLNLLNTSAGTCHTSLRLTRCNVTTLLLLLRTFTLNNILTNLFVIQQSSVAPFAYKISFIQLSYNH